MSKSEIKKKKVCLITSSLGKGGAERATINQATIFKLLNYEVYIVSITNDISYTVEGVSLFNLGEIKTQNNFYLGKIRSLLKLRAFLKTHDFNYVIDNRSRNSLFKEFVYEVFVFPRKKMIYVIHSFNRKIVFTSSQYFNKRKYKNSNIVSVSKAIIEDIKLNYNFKNVKLIYNGFDFKKLKAKAKEKNEKPLNDNYIIFYGRLDDKSKNLKLLLTAYSQSKLRNNNIKLLILGSGPDKDKLMNYSSSLQLKKDVVFKPFIANPFPYVKKALFLVLSSRYEGFPLVIPEALSLGVPVISVDCKSGPNEVIKNEYNGLLIKNYDETRLTKAMDRLYLDKELYLYCKNNAKASVAFFDVNNQLKIWKEYFEEIENNN